MAGRVFWSEVMDDSSGLLVIEMSHKPLMSSMEFDTSSGHVLYGFLLSVAKWNFNK